MVKLNVNKDEYLFSDKYFQYYTKITEKNIRHFFRLSVNSNVYTEITKEYIISLGNDIIHSISNKIEILKTFL
ncbi:MAG: hypothetical protein ACYDAO_10055 [Thermoplasmataceae archaeon]